MTAIWSKADLHIHSRHSDGADRIPAILRHVAEKTDLKVIAITDHETIDGALEARRIAHQYGLEVIVGEEVPSTEGHLLAYFIHTTIPGGLSLAESVRRVHAQGGLAVIAHPYDRLVHSPASANARDIAAWRKLKLDGVEGINGCQVDPVSNPKAMLLGAELGGAILSSSDAHHRGAIGSAHTLFFGETAEDLRKSMELGLTIPAGRSWIASEYVGWLFRSLIPRKLRSLLRTVPVPRLQPH